MKIKSLLKTVAVAASICAFTCAGTPMAHAQTSQSYAINNGMTFSFWDDSDGPSWGQNNNGNFWVSWSNYGNNNTATSPRVPVGLPITDSSSPPQSATT